jgi:hypothetical protein
MEATPQAKQLNLPSQIGIGLYFGLGLPILASLLKNVIPYNFALATSVVVLLLIAYPLFIRGTANVWTKDKRPHTFKGSIIFPLVVAISLFVISTFFFPEAP